jgi:cobalamin biosynthesis protein CobT
LPRAQGQTAGETDNAETDNAETDNGETDNAETDNAETDNAETDNAETDSETDGGETENGEVDGARTDCGETSGGGPDWLGAALRATLGTVVAARCRVRTVTVPHRTDQARKLTSIFGKRAGLVGSAADRCVKGTSYGLGGQEAPQADGQEEAPQTAAQDPCPASSSRQVARGAVDGACRADALAHLLRSRATPGRRCRSRPATRCAVSWRTTRSDRPHRDSDTRDNPRPAEASYAR